MSTSSYAVTTVPLDIGALVDIVTAPRADAPIGPGAIATFVGVVRNHNAGRRVERLEYEGYEPLAIRSFERMGKEACAQWDVRVALHHRLGTLQIGEASVVIAVASPHRADAFAACRYVIERVKQIAPIWKHEFFEGGDVWIEGATADPDNEDARQDAYRIAVGDRASASSVSATQPEPSGVAGNAG
ncbi:MAG: molybdenum cofactor biosynthesis protein MoaE [Acidobacteriota bacterium]|nr:molybdenum cofactor biosynthesis protein MoaE [Acidobacteriota bacterium]